MVGGGLRSWRGGGSGSAPSTLWDVAAAAAAVRGRRGCGGSVARAGEGGARGCGGRRGVAVTEDFVLEIYVLILCCKFGDDF